MDGYLDTIYDEKVRPRTKYPLLLCDHLFRRFSMRQGYKLLDVGCGRGDFLKGFKDLGLEVHGLDAEQSRFLTSESIEVKRADIESSNFPFESNIFDIVFSKSVIEHILNPDNFMKECYRVLKPGGRIIIMTPDWVSQMKIFFDDYTHRQPYTVTGIRNILDIFGFKKTSAGLFYQLPALWKYPALKIASRILGLFVSVTTKSGIKFIRWSVELMILGTGIK